MGLMERLADHFRGYDWLGAAGDQAERDLAVVELLVLAMGADGAEVGAEEDVVRRFCGAMAWSPPWTAEEAYRRAEAAVASALGRPGGVEELFESVCVRLADSGAQQFALTEVAETLVADGRIGEAEMAFVDRLRERFGLH